MTAKQLDNSAKTSQSTVTRRQMAAIVVRLAIANGLDVPISSLPKQVQAELVRQMTSLHHVDQATIHAAVSEFCNQFEHAGISFPGGVGEVLDLLGEAISPDVRKDLRRSAGLSLFANPWTTIAEQEVEALLPLLESEGTEVAAVVLSKLDTTKAASILGKLPGDKAREIAFAISLTGTIAPEIVDKIGTSVAELLDDKPVTAFPDDPIKRVGTILNYSPGATRDGVLEGLESENAEFAKEVRKNIFTFGDIPTRVETKDIPKILREVDPDVVLTALAGASGNDETTREFILDNMSKRMAEQLREDMAAKATPKTDEVDAAMTQFIVAIRQLEADGEITLKIEETDE